MIFRFEAVGPEPPQRYWQYERWCTGCDTGRYVHVTDLAYRYHKGIDADDPDPFTNGLLPERLTVCPTCGNPWNMGSDKLIERDRLPPDMEDYLVWNIYPDLVERPAQIGLEGSRFAIVNGKRVAVQQMCEDAKGLPL
jgi:hypothetical protein